MALKRGKNPQNIEKKNNKPTCVISEQKYYLGTTYMSIDDDL